MGHHIKPGEPIIPGTIKCDNGDGTYDIAWTFGGWQRRPDLGKSVEKDRRPGRAST